MHVRPGVSTDVGAAAAIVERCRVDLDARGIFQWDESYPSGEYFADALAVRTLFVLEDEGEVRAVTVLNEDVCEEWASIGWAYAHPLAMHAFAVDPPYQRRGYGARLLRVCEDFARERGYGCLRLDAFSEHAAALHFYERHGYSYRGAFAAFDKPSGHQLYFAYEKAL